MSVRNGMSGIDAGFERLLAGFDRTRLEEHHGAIFGLWDDYRLAYFNPAWCVFARENGGGSAFVTRWPLGGPTTDALPEALRSFYLGLYETCLRNSEPVEHVYECSSDRCLRRFHMTVYPLYHQAGLLVVNSLVVERPHDPREQAPCPPDANVYEDDAGLVHQCCHCRRMQRLDESGRWDWVPMWVREIPRNASHGLCPVCFDYHYGATGAA